MNSPPPQKSLFFVMRRSFSTARPCRMADAPGHFWKSWPRPQRWRLARRWTLRHRASYRFSERYRKECEVVESGKNMMRLGQDARGWEVSLDQVASSNIASSLSRSITGFPCAASEADNPPTLCPAAMAQRTMEFGQCPFPPSSCAAPAISV